MRLGLIERVRMSPGRQMRWARTPSQPVKKMVFEPMTLPASGTMARRDAGHEVNRLGVARSRQDEAPGDQHRAVPDVPEHHAEHHRVGETGE